MKPKAKPIKSPKSEFRVGIYMLGFAWVELWVDPTSDSGYFSWNPSRDRDPEVPKRHPLIMVGIKDSHLWAAYAILCHEVMEAAMCDLGLRYKQTGIFQDASSDVYHFVFNHNQFTEMAARTGSYLCDCRRDFERLFNQCHKKGKK